LPNVRTRIEPAPSGSIHVGNARTALFSWAFARRNSGSFVLRIADTDLKRVSEENYDAVLEDFRWLGLDWDEGPEVGGEHGPYRQSERFDIYREHAQKLIDGGFAYRDYLTADEIEAERNAARAAGRRPEFRPSDADLKRFEAEGRPSSIRFIVPVDRTITFHDEVLGDISTQMGHTPDFVILRTDGTPTYMLAVTVDDALMGITHIIRGNDLAASTPRQILMREALGWSEMPVFAHLPLIVAEGGKPLSKRWGDVSVQSYRDKGYVPEAIVNYLALLGWSLDDHTNIFSVEDLISNFALDRVSKNPAAFDVAKLEWVNMHYIKALSADELAARVMPFLERAGISVGDGRDKLAAVAPLIVERLKRLDEAPEMVRFLFERPPFEGGDDPKWAKVMDGQDEYLKAGADALEALEKWSTGSIEAALRALAEQRELKPKQAFQPIRATVTGTLVSPPLFESLEILGRDETVWRLRNVRAG
jgi:glutamyl-tRNA synthetase